MSDWKECILGDVLNFRRGYDLPKGVMVAGEIPVAGSNGIIGWHNVATPINPVITIGRSGSIGHPFIYEQAWAHNTTLYIDNFKGNHPKYLYYLLFSLPLAQWQAGSAVPTLNRNHIHPIPIKFPSSLIEQKKIAGILSALDEKIETNRKINARLEELAQAIFKSWFIDFTPFGGQMPLDWRTCKLSEILTVKYGKDHKKLQDGKIPVYGSGGIMRYAKKALYDQESILIPRKGTLNNIVYVDDPFWSVDTMFYTEMKIANVSKYIFYCLKRLDFEQMNSGSAIPSMTTNILNALTLNLPTHEILNNFEKDINPIFFKIKSFNQQSDQLAELRDTLLPKLMSGELIPE